MNEWEQFENDVRGLLRLQGWFVEPERILGHKKVDAYAEKAGEFMKKQRIAVECKHYKEPISQAQLSEIFTNYLPLVQENLIDSLLVVTLNGLSPSAQSFAQSAKGLIHITFDNLLYSSIDFSSYIQGMKSQYYDGNLSRLYTEQPFKDDARGEQIGLAQALFSWTQKEGDRPVAVLGGYGMGKSTLARHLAFLCALEHLANPRVRIPILIKLEDVVTDQSLEGLLGRHFTYVAVVPNYNFHTFMMLNANGRFVILLDGFDEMKKTMSWEAMRYNLQQLNRLVVPQSKVVLLGRPTAFLNAEEYSEALHGRRSVLSSDRSIPDWPDYMEFHLLPFQLSQIEEYISKYVEVLKKQKTKTIVSTQIDKLLNLVTSNKENQLLDLASRPVQLKMLLEILPYYQGDIDNLTTTILYSEFIDLVIRRELTKKAREAFSVKDRRRFASELAFWMWENNTGTEVLVSSLSENLFEEFKLPGVPLDSVKRDLLSGCFLERKPPEGLYFPHRSFLEFLVAERLAEMIAKRDPRVPLIIYVSPEITQFFIELIGKKTVVSWRGWMRILKRKQVISAQCVGLLAGACQRHGVRLTERFLAELRGGVTTIRTDNFSSNETLEQIDDKREKRLKKGQKKSPHRLAGIVRKKDFRGNG